MEKREEQERLFLSEHPEFNNTLRMGATCGVNTVTEAIMQVERNYYILPDHIKVLDQIYKDELEWMEDGFGEYIPAWLIQEEDKKLDQYFEQQRKEMNDVLQENCAEAECLLFDSCKKSV